MRLTLAHTFLSLIVAGLFLGCSAQPDVKALKYPPPPVDAPLVKMVDQLGDAAAVVVVLDPREWSKIRAFVDSNKAHLGGPGQAIVQGMSAPKTFLESMAAARGVPNLVDTLDGDRPVVFGLFQPVLDGTPGLGAQMSPVGQVPIPGIRHEALIPTRDAKGLIKALGTLLDGVSKRQGDQWKRGPFSVGLRDDGDIVRVMVLSHNFQPDEANTTPLWPTARTPSLRTPALAKLTSGGAPVSALIRPWRVRGVAVTQGLYNAVEALRHAPPEVRQVMMAMGLSLVLSGEGLILSSRPEYDDHAVAVIPSGHGLTIDMVSSLTPRGRDIHQAGVADVMRYPLKKQAVVEAIVGFNFPAAVKAVGPDPIFPNHPSDTDVANAIRECGPGCIVHAFTRVPWASFAAAAGGPQRRAKFIGQFPRGGQIAVLDSKDGAAPEAFAAVLTVPNEFKIKTFPPLKKLAKTVDVALESIGKRKVLLVSQGVDPKTVFDLTQPKTPEQLFAVSVAERFINHAPVDHIPPARILTKAISSVDIDARLAANGRSVNWRLDMESGPSPAPTRTESADLKWASPIMGYEKTEGDACLLAALKETQLAFAIVGSAPADQRWTLFDRSRVAAEPHLKCAEKIPATAKAAAGLRAQIKLLVASYKASQALEVAPSPGASATPQTKP